MIERSWLIQRFNLPTIASDKGNVFDQNCVPFGYVMEGNQYSVDALNNVWQHLANLHYMGTAELECGGVFDSFKRFADNIKKYNVYTIKVVSDRNIQASVYIVAREDQIEEMAKRIKGWAKGIGEELDVDVKDSVNLNDAINGVTHCGHKFLFPYWLRNLFHCLWVFKWKRMYKLSEDQRGQGWLDVSNDIFFFRNKLMFERFCWIFGLNCKLAYWGIFQEESR